MDALKPVSHYKRRKKINLSTAIICIAGVIGIAIIIVMGFRIYDQHKYEQKMKDFIKGEFSIYKSHYKRLPFDVFIQAKKISMKEELPLEEILSLMNNESGFNRYALSRSGADGLCQLMPETQKNYKVTDPHNIKQNIRAGVKYYKYCKMRANGNIELAYKKYNGGHNRKKFTPGGESEIYSARCMADLIATTIAVNRYRIYFAVV